MSTAKSLLETLKSVSESNVSSAAYYIPLDEDGTPIVGSGGKIVLFESEQDMKKHARTEGMGTYFGKVNLADLVKIC